jgi:hypothetical protein
MTYMRLFRFASVSLVGRTPWAGGSAGSKADTYTVHQKQKKKHRQTSMPRVEFETTIPVFKREKEFHALGRANYYRLEF